MADKGLIMHEKELQDRIKKLEKRISDLERESAEKEAMPGYISEIFETSGNAINSVDLKGIITSWNPASEMIFGYTAKEAIGKSISIIKPRKYHTDAFLKNIRYGEKVLDYETQRMHKDGRLVDVSLNLSPIKDGTGRIIGVSSIARDISERKRLLRELFHSEKMAAIGKLTSGIAHEFNNFIGMMRGYAELALDKKDPALMEEALDVVINMSDRAARIIKNLVDFSRRREPKKESIDVIGTIESALSLVSRDLEKAGIAVERDYSLTSKMFADEDQLEQVFFNIIINALHAMPKGGSLTIRTGKRGKNLWACFSDTGCGIKKENLDKIFEPFFTTKGAIGGSETPGTGLGLSMADGIIRNHGGIIEVESTIGKGSTFTVLLPAHAEEEIAPAREKAAGTGPGETPAADILVIDDEEFIIEIIKRILEGGGHRVTTAQSGSEAREFFENKKFDIVFCDVLMPDGGGLDILQLVKKVNPGTEVVLLTGKDVAEIEKDATTCGAHSCLRKPFKIATINSTVAGIMSKKAGGRAK